MAAAPERPEPAIVAEFWERWLADQKEARPRTLAEYQALWPGHAATIEREWRALAADADEEPARIAHFRLLHELGRGGEATVHLAEDERLQRRVALKVMRASFARDALERFRHEAEITARLDPIGICPVYEAGSADGLAYIAMRYVEGRTLASILDERKRVAEPRSAGEVRAVVDLVARIARILHRAHALGIVHRDVKPGNVIVDPSGAPVLLDFGLARETTQGDVFAQSGVFAGTPAYMAPEQIDPARGPRDARTDVHALGVLLHEALTLERTFEAPTREALYQRILTHQVPDVRSGNPALPRDLAVVVATATRKRPEDRYASAAALADDLQAVLDSRPITARRPSLLRRCALWARRERRLALALVGVAVLSLAVSAGIGYLLSELPKVRAIADERHREEVLESAFLRYEIFDAEGALGRFEEVLTALPGHEEASAGAVLCEMQLQRTGAALARLDRLRRAGSSPPWVARLRVMALERAKDHAAAAAARQELGESRSAFDWFVAGLEIVSGSEYRLSARADAAVRAFSRAVALAGRARVLYHCERARAAGHGSSAEIATESAEALLALWPESSVALVYAAQALARFAPERAVEHARTALARAPSGDRGIAMNVAYVLGRAGDAGGAAAVLADLVARDPDDTLAHGNLATALLILKQPRAALPHARRAAALSTRYDDDRALLFDALVSCGEDREAGELVRRATEAEPDNVRAWLARATLERKEGDRAAARTSLARALALAPENGEVVAQEVHEALSEANVERARAALDRALATSPQDASLRLIAGRLLLATGEPEAALAAFEAALALGEEGVAARLGIYLARRATLGVAGARAALRAFASAPDAARELRPQLQSVAWNEERTAEVFAELDAWTSSEPDSVAAWRAATLFAARRGDDARALAAARRWRTLAPRTSEAWRCEAEAHLRALAPDAELAPEGLTAAREAVALGAEGDLENLLTLARALAARGAREEARQVAERGLAASVDEDARAAFGRVVRRASARR